MPKSAKAIPNLRLKEVRELRGWSQKYVADQIGADNYYLSRWEHGTASPSPYYRRKLCLLFGMDAKELGLLREETIEDVALPIQRSGSSPASSEPLRDPSIPLPFAGGYGLVGRDDIVNQLKQRLFNSRNVVLTALNGLPARSGVGYMTFPQQEVSNSCVMRGVSTEYNSSSTRYIICKKLQPL
jgi:transcriptional regulator with XRE-family HTH domain